MVQSCTGGQCREAVGEMATGDVGAVMAAIRAVPGWPELTAPKGYPDSMALCVMDAIWSMGVRYSSVEHLLTRYRTWLKDDGRGSANKRTLTDLIGDIDACGGPEGFADSLKNHSRTSPRNGVLKAAAVLEAADRLSDAGVNRSSELRRLHNDPEIKKLWCGVKGQSSGISWHYLLILAGVDDVKADRMICRFVEEAVGRRPVSHDEAHQLVVVAHSDLRPEAPGLSLRALDHAIWNAQRARGR